MTVPQIVRVAPPAHLLAPTPEPVCDPATNAELLDCLADYIAALRRANADKAAAREAVATPEEPSR